MPLVGLPAIDVIVRKMTDATIVPEFDNTACDEFYVNAHVCDRCFSTD